jgi:PAS domain S-box-containing protein
MKDEDKTKKQLLEELAGLRRRGKRPAKAGDACKGAEQDLRKSNELLASIGRAQSRFISAHEPRVIFDGLLKDILSLTGSKYGFIGEALRSSEGLPYLKTHAVTNIAWDRKTRRLYNEQAEKGMEFHNLDNLFGAVLRTGKPVVSNRPAKDRRRGGLPEGHPPLESFLGIPLYCGKKLVGMAGIANRPGGYDRPVAGFLRPLLSTCANIIEACRINRDRIEARGEANEARELLRSTVNGVAGPIMVIGLDYRVLLLNRAARDFFQRRDEEHGDLYCYQLSHHGDEPCHLRSDYLCPHKEVLSTGEAVSTVHRHYGRDGELRYVEVVSSPLRDAGGGIRGIIQSFSDITERKRAEDALRLLKKSIETISVGLAITDADGGIVYANPAEARMHGYRAEELIGMDMGVLAPRELRKALTVDDMKDLGEWSRESANVRKDGTVFPVRLTSVAVRDEEGTPTNMITISEDITERKRMEEALLEKEARLQALVQAIPDSVVFKDAQGRHLLLNKACEETFGLREEDVLGKTAEEILPPALAESCRRSDEKVMKAGRPFLFEERSHGPDGGETVFETIKAPLYDDRGDALGLIAVSRDITGRKRLEKALRESIEGKEMLIKEVHHRVKNNLAVIASLLRLQSRELKDEKTRSILDESRNRVRSMSLIHEKLYISGDLKNVDFKEYLRELSVRLFHSYETGSGVKLVLDVEDALLDVDTVIPCGLIVNELISNALKYAFPGGRSGEVSVGFHSVGEGRYALTVRDDGVGFPEGMDFRNTNTFGMQIVTSLTLQLSGTVELKRDGGTEFTVTFRENGFKKG